MITFEAELKQWGNSYGIRIPKSVAEKAGLSRGDKIRLPLEKKQYAIDECFGMWRGSKPFVRDRDDRF